MERNYKNHSVSRQLPGGTNIYPLAVREIGGVVLLVAESCALVAWQAWKTFHPKPKNDLKA